MSITNASGDTALHLATNIQQAQYLVEQGGVPLNVLNNRLETPLQRAKMELFRFSDFSTNHSRFRDIVQYLESFIKIPVGTLSHASSSEDYDRDGSIQLGGRSQNACDLDSPCYSSSRSCLCDPRIFVYCKYYVNNSSTMVE